MQNWSKFDALFNGINISVYTMLLTLNERIFCFQLSRPKSQIFDKTSVVPDDHHPVLCSAV